MEDIIDVVVIGFEKPEETLLTIKTLLEANDDIRIILVHDGSIQKPNLDSLPADKIVQLHLKHSGQPKAINAGLKLVKSEYVVVTHNDIIIKDKGWIRKAVNFLKENKEAGLVCTLGWQIVYNGLIHSPRHSISSLKNYTNCENYTVLKKDFEEVFMTDNYANVFETGLKADERYGIVGLSFWIDIKAKGLKCYVMRFDDGTHLKISARDLEIYKKMADFDKQWDKQNEITNLRMKEYGIVIPPNKLRVKLKAIEHRDIENLRVWRNKHIGKNVFFHNEYIGKKEQVEWFKEYLKQVDDKLFMIEYQGKDIGCIGYRPFENYIELYNVMFGYKKYSGRGLMSEAMYLIYTHINTDKDIIARVIKDNEIGIAFYLNNSFEVKEVKDDYVMVKINYDSSYNNYL